MGYGHWVLMGLTAFILLLIEWRDGNVARNPFFAAVVLIFIGIVTAMLQGDFKKIGFLDFMLFMNVDYASTTIAIGYSLFVFGLVKPIVTLIKKKQFDKLPNQ